MEASSESITKFYRFITWLFGHAESFGRGVLAEAFVFLSTHVIQSEARASESMGADYEVINWLLFLVDL